MLKHLHIENYALIESLDIDLHQGFSVITGETGAGKSILLGAIGLLTGERADLSVIQSGKQRCTLEATFDISKYSLEDFFHEADLDYDATECIVRRELTSNGKSRAFINDTPTTISVLKQLGNRLIDIHSQHQNLLLGQENFQISVLDTVAASPQLLKNYTDAYHHWLHTCQELKKARTSLAEGQKDEDYVRFLVTELNNFRPQPAEDETLQQECNMLEHAQEIKVALMQGYGLLSEGEMPAIDGIRQVRNLVSSISKFFPQAEELAERLDSCRIELQDIADTLEQEGEAIDYDPERLDQVQSRLNTLYSLEQKHHVSSSDQLITIMEELQQKLDMMDNSEAYLQEMEAAERKAKAEVESIASQLTKTRAEAAKKVETDIIKSLKLLGMPNVRFQVALSPADEPQPLGMDKVAFLFSANLGAEMQNIAQVASGGEMARVMLSLKAILSEAISLPTIIFDEIDTGVSGHIAESMAKIMKQMGLQGLQVISITHLPQIAAMGQHHYKVWKEDTATATLSHISPLSAEERITEIANMLSGSNVTPEAINNAHALLSL